MSNPFFWGGGRGSTVTSMHVATAPHATESTTVRAGGGLEESWFVEEVVSEGKDVFILESRTERVCGSDSVRVAVA
jgi:hypothetical protein